MANRSDSGGRDAANGTTGAGARGKPAPTHNEGVGEVPQTPTRRLNCAQAHGGNAGDDDHRHTTARRRSSNDGRRLADGGMGGRGWGGGEERPTDTIKTRGLAGVGLRAGSCMRYAECERVTQGAAWDSTGQQGHGLPLEFPPSPRYQKRPARGLAWLYSRPISLMMAGPSDGAATAIPQFLLHAIKYAMHARETLDPVLDT